MVWSMPMQTVAEFELSGRVLAELAIRHPQIQ